MHTPKWKQSTTQWASKRGFRFIAPSWYYFSSSRARIDGDAKGVVSIFFSKMPDRIRASNIYDLFGCYGEVEGVVFPSKRNRWGKHYGFARFTDSEDARMLVVRLDNILLTVRRSM